MHHQHTSFGPAAASGDTLPAAPDAERYVIGALIAWPTCAADVFSRLRASDFSDAAHRAAFGVLARQHAAGGIDPVLAARELEGHREFAGVEPAAWLVELGQDVPTSVHVLAQVVAIVDARRKRQLVDIAEHVREGATNGQAADDVFGALQADLFEFGRDTYGEPRYRGIDAQELASSRYDLTYIVPGVLVEGQPAFLGGPKKSLKTSLAMDLALSVATGGCWLGKFRVDQPRPVVFLSGESGLATLQETALRICRAMGVELSGVAGFTLCTTLPSLHDACDLADCERFLGDIGAEVAIFDPLYLMLTGDDAGNLFKQGALLRNVAELCQSLGVTPVLCHHSKSTIADPFAPAELDHLAWSGCAEFARQWLLVSRREQYEPGTGDHRLWLTAGGSAGHSGLWAVDVAEGRQSDPRGRRWEVRVESATDARAAAADRKRQEKDAQAAEQLALDRSAVCKFLAQHPEGVTKTFIRDHCGVSGRRFPAVLAAMYDAGEVVTCEVTVGNKKTPQAGYRLPK